MTSPKQSGDLAGRIFQGPAPHDAADPTDTSKCPACGKMNDADAKFCDQCGAKMPDSVAYKVDPGETVKCPSCGKMNDTDAKWCDQCGVKLPATAFPKGDAGTPPA